MREKMRGNSLPKVSRTPPSRTVFALRVPPPGSKRKLPNFQKKIKKKRAWRGGADVIQK